jgi:hypothetical protein
MVDTSHPKLAVKLIKNVDQLEIFIKGNTFNKIMDFIFALQKSVENSNRYDISLPEV